MMTREQFLYHLRYVLNHLYDPHCLHDSPLAPLLGVAEQPDMPSALRRILTEAIESLKPAVDLPSQSRAWRIYELLFYRYVQQFSQRAVADQLGLSVRHLRREQQVALDALAGRLWGQFHLTEMLDEETGVENVALPVGAAGPTVNDELAWLKGSPAEESIDLGQALPIVLSLVRPLATRHGVYLDITIADSLPKLAAHPVALRQALLNLLSTAIPRASGGRVCISAQLLSWEVEIQVFVDAQSHREESRSSSELRGPAPEPILDDDRVRLDMTRQLTSLCGGRLTLSSEEGTFAATLTLPVLERFPVLVIDDNADTLQLLQRYASGTRYRLVGVRDPEQALSLAEQLAPQIIVLDVMMPQVDGWEVLGRLQQHPLTGHIPIVVCTILAQEELALSLGASVFVRKPVSRQTFLAALDHQVAQMEIGPR
jgi:CheY-like chemotaxis protein